MAQPSGRFLRDNAFLVAAVLLPVVVVGFFLLSTAIPRWTVPPPAYDLLLRSQKPYDSGRPRIAIEFEVRDGRVRSARTAAPDATCSRRSCSFRSQDDERQRVRSRRPCPARSAIRRDGVRRRGGRTSRRRRDEGARRLRLETRTHHGPGLLGDIFGMNHYDIGLSLVNRGRVIPIALPEPYRSNYYSAYFVGWVVDGGR
jgi:hypothetical protein